MAQTGPRRAGPYGVPAVLADRAEWHRRCSPRPDEKREVLLFLLERVDEHGAGCFARVGQGVPLAPARNAGSRPLPRADPADRDHFGRWRLMECF
jgi:hypothetical protein